MTKDEFLAALDAGTTLQFRSVTLWELTETKNSKAPLGLITDQTLANQIRTNASHIYIVEAQPMLEVLDPNGGDSVWVRAGIMSQVVDTPSTLDGQISDILTRITPSELAQVLDTFTPPGRKNPIVPA